jgi:biotin carboxylase
VTTNHRHIVIVNRWRERYADYPRYLDHDAHHVTYVTTEVGLAAVPDAAAAVALVAKTNDLEAVREAVSTLADRFGPPAEIIALKEDDLLTVAELREEWGCPGQRPHDLTRFLDKYEMYRLIAHAGLTVPPFELAHDVYGVCAFAGVHGWPVVLKPRIGGASEDVVCADDATEVSEILHPERPMLVQAFDPRPVYHVNGVFAQGRLALWRVSRYMNTCLAFREGRFLGSVEEDDEALNQAVADASLRYLRALTDGTTTFHLELFVDREARGGPACSFLEVGARVGGGENALVWREVHGIDLMEIAFRLHRGLPPLENVEHGPSDVFVTGQVYIPSPLPRPCLITEVTPTMLGRPNGPYAESVPRPGEILPDAESYYEHVGGRFRFCGRSTREVEAAILATVAEFHVAAEPVRAEEVVS